MHGWRARSSSPYSYTHTPSQTCETLLLYLIRILDPIYALLGSQGNTITNDTLFFKLVRVGPLSDHLQDTLCPCSCPDVLRFFVGQLTVVRPPFRRSAALVLGHRYHIGSPFVGQLCLIGAAFSSVSCLIGCLFVGQRPYCAAFRRSAALLGLTFVGQLSYWIAFSVNGLAGPPFRREASLLGRIVVQY